MTTRWGIGVMVIPAPHEVDALMKRVPRGKVTTINELRAALARKHKADFACPITMGIFSWIAAHAAAEDAAAGRCGRTQTHHALLAHVENRRGVESEVSGWDSGFEETAAR